MAKGWRGLSYQYLTAVASLGCPMPDTTPFLANARLSIGQVPSTVLCKRDQMPPHAGEFRAMMIRTSISDVLRSSDEEHLPKSLN